MSANFMVEGYMAGISDYTGAHGRGESNASINSIRTSIHDLANNSSLIRDRARRTLVSAGRAAVTPLIDALGSPSERARWEAAKALCEIREPTAANALVTALEDDDRDVRWMAAEALIAMGSDGLRPLFRALIRRSNSVWVRNGAQRVLRALWNGEKSDIVEPVLEALENAVPRVEVPVAAYEGLRRLDGEEPETIQ